MLFCLVHGAWHDEACWQPLVDELGHRGHECVVPVLPLDDDRASFDDYAEVVADRLRGRELPVLVGHSMSSAVIPLVAVKRPARLLVYLCPAMGGFPPPRGEPPWRRAGYDSPPVDATGRSLWPRDRAIAQLYKRMEPQLAERLADRLRPQPQSVFDGPYPLARPPDVPSAFIYAREDELFDDRWSGWAVPATRSPVRQSPSLVLTTAQGQDRCRQGRRVLSGLLLCDRCCLLATACQPYPPREHRHHDDDDESDQKQLYCHGRSMFL